MPEEKLLPFGTIKENDGVVIVDIPLRETDITDMEQLEELKRDNSSFFPCQHYVEEGENIRIYYKRPKDYKPLESVELDQTMSLHIARQILQAEQLNGTQYTTSFRPENIYVTDEGSVKFAHRGIRSILPPGALSGAAFLQEAKRFLIYLYTGRAFSDIDPGGVEVSENAFVDKIRMAESVLELGDILENPGVVSEDKLGQGESHLAQGAGQQTETDLVNNPEDPYVNGSGSLQQHTYDEHESPQVDGGLGNTQQVQAVGTDQDDYTTNKGRSDKKLSPLTIGLLGFIGGLLFLYLFQVMPLGKENDKLAAAFKSETASFEDDKESLEEENAALEDELSDHERIEEAYRHMLEDETDDAISALEGVDDLNGEVSDTLVDLYIKSNRAESLTKALDMDTERKDEIVKGLAVLDSDDANAVIADQDPSDPVVKLEQEWLDDAYEDVIAIYEDDLNDSTRAKYLAAKSYIELDKPDEARKLGESLNNKEVQIASLEKEKKLVEDDDDMDKDDRKDEVKKIDKKIKKLKK